MSKGRIYCLMGKSGSGKDTIFKKLINKVDLKPVVIYTTRPKRINEETGVDYHFIKQEDLNKFEEAKKIIELRYYNTVQGWWAYATVDDGQIDLNNGNYILITTLEAYGKIKQYYGRDSVAPIYINVEDGIRFERVFFREKAQNIPNYTEICRRYLADCNDFNEEKLKNAGVVKFYNNFELEKCVDEIINNEKLK